MPDPGTQSAASPAAQAAGAPGEGTAPLAGARTAVPAVRVEAVLAAGDAAIVDLRSPREFGEDHLPGAVNVPLFDDLERALIGTLYRRASPERAFDEGLARTRRRIGELVEEIAGLAGWEPPGADPVALVERIAAGGLADMEGQLVPRPAPLPARAVVLHCWRGGMRSRSVVALLRALGLERAVCLEGGYKRYRAHVRGVLDGWQAPPAFVLRGLTGVGKTLVLRAIERLRPGWTLDLEALAGHRSSILGMVGLEPVSQKTFESGLATRIAAGFPDGLVVLEGESRKVGDAIVPDRVWRALRGGTALEVVASTPRRVRVLIEDYLAREENRDALARQLPFIEERLGAAWHGVLVDMLARREDEALTAGLLEHYYDPLYAHSESRFRKERAAAGLPGYEATFDAGDAVRAATEIVRWIERRTGRA